MNEDNKCPNCGQYKIERRSALMFMVIGIGAAAIFIITLPLEIFLIPATIVAAFIPSMRAKYRFCRNCKWSEKASHQSQTA